MLTRLNVPIVGGAAAALGPRPFAAITKADLEAMREARRAELQEQQVQEALQQFQAIGRISSRHLHVDPLP